MTPATTFAGRTVALFGLGGSGLATALALQAGGAEVVAWDDNPKSVAKAAGQGVGTGDLRAADWSRFAALVLSPGVPLTHPEPHWTVPLARAAGVEVIGDIELFCRERAKLAPHAPFIAITGTNGKSTTTALIAHILREAGCDVQMGGNIGTAILSLAPPARDRIHVIEMSSFQIDLTPNLMPTFGVLLNISPDHLDRHGTMENYVKIKQRMAFESLCPVVGLDDPWCMAIADDLREHGVRYEFFSASPDRRPMVYTRDHKLYRGEREQLADLNGIVSLRGGHNALNAAAAFATLLNFTGFPRQVEAMQAALRSFPGLPHRMEEVGRRERALFVNDSKATNADSTAKALASFDRIFWIVGGRAKAGGISGLTPYFPKIAKAYLVGESSDDFARTLKGKVGYVRAGTLDVAVAQASEDAARSGEREPVVLLSPACASYDQFPNYEVRGDRFRELVRALPGIEVNRA